MRFKPLIDKLYWIVFLPTAALMVGFTVLICLTPVPFAIFTVAMADLLVLYFFISPLFGYVEAREDTVFIKYGLILRKEIPYSKIRSATRGRGIVSDSMLSLKNAMEHVVIKYNRFDVTVVSVKDNDGLLRALTEARSKS